MTAAPLRVVGSMLAALLLGASLTPARAAKPDPVHTWLQAACDSGKERTRPVTLVLPATARAPTAPVPTAAEVQLDGSGYRIDGTPVADDDLLDAIGRAFRQHEDIGLSGPVLLIVERSVPATRLTPLLRALAQLPPHPLAVGLRSIRGTQLPEPPDPAVAAARALQVSAILDSVRDPMARLHALTALGPRLAVPAGTCPELDVALRSTAAAFPACNAAASDVMAVLARCRLDETATRRAATVVGLSWAPPESPPLVVVPIAVAADGHALAGTWEDVVHALLRHEHPRLKHP